MQEDLPIKMLQKDHRKVEELFSECRKIKDPREKAKLIKKIVKELEIHAEVEEQYFYPEVADVSEEGMQMIGHSKEEHQEMKNMMQWLREVNEATASDDEKLAQLEGIVNMHVKEEESKVFPFAQKNIQDKLGVALSGKMLALKEKLRIQNR